MFAVIFGFRFCSMSAYYRPNCIPVFLSLYQDVKRATTIAMEYRAKFQRDVVIDLICFRRWGHNEIDEPAFTQPVMYNVINNRMSIPDLYAQQVVVSIWN